MRHANDLLALGWLGGAEVKAAGTGNLGLHDRGFKCPITIHTHVDDNPQNARHYDGFRSIFRPLMEMAKR